ncbi:MAG: PstS family phosphate ABC transporter substrate-binding protein [Chloroflexi bacterium]|nr:PstS family phosphate ABC transporter substrate-binding protein [Chloroflexota bacterium]
MTNHMRGLVAILLLLLAACGPQTTETATPLVPAVMLLAGDSLAPINPALVSGPIEITGSSTVYPLTARVAEEFALEGSPAQIDVKVTGTGGGFRSFCSGDPVDIVNASRPITPAETDACRAVGREPLGFQVGIDALAVVVSNENQFVERLSFAQLAQIFSGQVRTWREVDPTYPDAPISLFSPGVDSGTFDYFVEAVLGGDEALIPAVPGVVLSEDDTELLRGIEENPFAIGYFGFAYYQSDQERLRALAIDGGNGPVAPGAATVVDGSYPLARPLFIYTSSATLAQDPTVAAFISYYLQNVNELVVEVGYFPVPATTIDAAQQALVAALR